MDPRPALSAAFFSAVVRRRTAVLLGMTVVTLALAALARRAVFDSPAMDLFPRGHPYVKTFLDYQDVLSGADRLFVVIAVEEGEIFTPAALAKVQRLTRALESLPEAHPYQTASLAQRKVKDLVFLPDGNFARRPLMWPQAPSSAAAIAELRRRAIAAPGVLGRLLSRDLRAAAIEVGVLPIKDYRGFYARLRELARREEDERTRIYMIGRPALLGEILTRFPQLLPIFAGALAVTALLLAAYFRSPAGVAIPLLTAGVSALWSLGVAGAAGINVDPLVLAVPVALAARSLSHSIQFVDRFDEEMERVGDRSAAVVAAGASLLQPALLAILLDAAALLTLLLIPLPVLQKVSLLAAAWVLSTLAVNFVLHPALLSALPWRGRRRARWDGAYLRLASGLSRLSEPRRFRLVLGFVGASFLACVGLSLRLEVGDPHPGSFLLWPRSRYNADAAAINGLFGATDLLSVVAAGERAAALKDPRVLRGLALLQRELESLPAVAATFSVADLYETFNRLFHSGDPRWQALPAAQEEAGFLHFAILGSAEPGDLDGILAADGSAGAVSVFLEDHAGPTLARVIETCKGFIGAHELPGVTLRLAGGYAGLLAAIDETVSAYRWRLLLFSFSIALVFTATAYRSLSSALVVTLPLLVVNFWAEGLMALTGISLGIHSLPVVAVGVGLGIDFGIYVLSRMRDESRAGAPHGELCGRALATTGRAVTLTAITMSLSCLLWSASFLKFQAEMGLLLTAWMAASWFAGMTLVPGLALRFQRWPGARGR